MSTNFHGEGESYKDKLSKTTAQWATEKDQYESTVTSLRQSIEQMQQQIDGLNKTSPPRPPSRKKPTVY